MNSEERERNLNNRVDDSIEMIKQIERGIVEHIKNLFDSAASSLKIDDYNLANKEFSALPKKYVSAKNQKELKQISEDVYNKIVVADGLRKNEIEELIAEAKKTYNGSKLEEAKEIIADLMNDDDKATYLEQIDVVLENYVKPKELLDDAKVSYEYGDVHEALETYDSVLKMIERQKENEKLTADNHIVELEYFASKVYNTIAMNVDPAMAEDEDKITPVKEVVSTKEEVEVKLTDSDKEKKFYELYRNAFSELNIDLLKDAKAVADSIEDEELRKLLSLLAVFANIYIEEKTNVKTEVEEIIEEVKEGTVENPIEATEEPIKIAKEEVVNEGVINKINELVSNARGLVVSGDVNAALSYVSEAMKLCDENKDIVPEELKLEVAKVADEINGALEDMSKVEEEPAIEESTPAVEEVSAPVVEEIPAPLVEEPAEPEAFAENYNMEEFVQLVKDLNSDKNIDIETNAVGLKRIIINANPSEYVLPFGWYYNEKNGFTNKHNTRTGLYTSFEVINRELVQEPVVEEKVEEPVKEEPAKKIINIEDFKARLIPLNVLVSRNGIITKEDIKNFVSMVNQLVSDAKKLDNATLEGYLDNINNLIIIANALKAKQAQDKNLQTTTRRVGLFDKLDAMIIAAKRNFRLKHKAKYIREYEEAKAYGDEERATKNLEKIKDTEDISNASADIIISAQKIKAMQARVRDIETAIENNADDLNYVIELEQERDSLVGDLGIEKANFVTNSINELEDMINEVDLTSKERVQNMVTNIALCLSIVPEAEVFNVVAKDFLNRINATATISDIDKASYAYEINKVLKYNEMFNDSYTTYRPQDYEDLSKSDDFEEHGLYSVK